MDVVVVDPASGVECDRAAFDAFGKLLNPEEAIGELVNRTGASRFEGYYERPDANRERLRSGWYWSGDLGYRDEAGFFYFAGRNGDWLRVDSENMAAGPIEAVLSRYPAFNSVLIYGVPSPFGGGEEVMAAVELESDHHFNGSEFSQWLAQQPDLGTKWAPMFVAVCDRLPTTATGKLTKVPLKVAGLKVEAPIYWCGARRNSTYVALSTDERATFTANEETTAP
jgi:fatty-acyl-CoA synthase